MCGAIPTISTVSQSPCRVSVIIPAYNAAQTLGETLDSVFRQTFTDFEVIVVDDGSTDDTRSVTAPYGDRVRVLGKQNEGKPSATRNLGVREARGEYIAFLDADDCWEKDKLMLQVEIMARDADVGLVYTADAHIDAGSRVLSINPCIPGARGHLYDLLRVNNVMVGSSVMLRRRAFDQVGGFDEQLTSIENWDLWIRVAKKWRVECIDQPLTLYRVHAGNRSENVELRRRNLFQVLAKHHDASDRSRKGRRLRREAYFHAYFNVLGRGYMRRLDMKSARPMLARAACLKPRPDVLRLLGLSLLGRRGFLLLRALKRSFRGHEAVSRDDRAARP